MVFGWLADEDEKIEQESDKVLLQEISVDCSVGTNPNIYIYNKEC